MRRTKQVSGKTYHWCVKQKLWTLHVPEECQLGKTPLLEETSREMKQDADEGGKKSLKHQDLQTIIDLTDSSSDEESNE